MNTKKLNRVKSIDFLDGYRVQVGFDDGFAGIVDLEPALEGYYLEPLKEVKLFRQGRLERGTLAWPNEAALCPDVLRHWCEIGRVCSQEELDAAFERQSQTVEQQ